MGIGPSGNRTKWESPKWACSGPRPCRLSEPGNSDAARGGLHRASSHVAFYKTHVASCVQRAAPRGDHFVARRVGVQQMVRADRADLVLPRRQRVPLQHHTIALQHAATTRQRHACRVPHAARDSTATRRVTSSARNARACMRARALRLTSVHACASVGAGGWLPCPWAAARKAAATAARRRTASCLRRAVCPIRARGVPFPPQRTVQLGADGLAAAVAVIRTVIPNDLNRYSDYPDR